MSKKRRIPEMTAPSDVVRPDNPDDYTGVSAKDRVLFVNFWFVKYGTTDRIQGAAMFLALILMIFIFTALVLGFFHDKTWAKEVIAWLGTPLLLVIGVAVGRGKLVNSDDD